MRQGGGGLPGSGVIRLRGAAIPLLQHACSGGVHEIIAHDVVLSCDPRVGVPEEFGCEVDATGLVDRRRSGATESMRGHAVQSCFVHHVAESAADVVRCEWIAVAVAEQERIGIDREPFLEPCADRGHRKLRQRDRPHRT